MKKKTLDDYFLQIKKGKNLGFELAKHLNDPIGVLRKFVKSAKLMDNLKKNKIKSEGKS